MKLFIRRLPLWHSNHSGQLQEGGADRVASDSLGCTLLVVRFREWSGVLAMSREALGGAGGFIRPCSEPGASVDTSNNSGFALLSLGFLCGGLVQPLPATFFNRWLLPALLLFIYILIQASFLSAELSLYSQLLHLVGNEGETPPCKGLCCAAFRLITGLVFCNDTISGSLFSASFLQPRCPALPLLPLAVI